MLNLYLFTRSKGIRIVHFVIFVVEATNDIYAAIYWNTCMTISTLIEGLKAGKNFDESYVENKGISDRFKVFSGAASSHDEIWLITAFYVELTNRSIFEKALVITVCAECLMEPFFLLSIITNYFLWLSNKINNFCIIYSLNAFCGFNIRGRLRIKHHLIIQTFFGMIWESLGIRRLMSLHLLHETLHRHATLMNVTFIWLLFFQIDLAVVVNRGRHFIWLTWIHFYDGHSVNT